MKNILFRNGAQKYIIFYAKQNYFETICIFSVIFLSLSKIVLFYCFLFYSGFVCFFYITMPV